MDSCTVIFWLVCLSCLSGATVLVTRMRSASRGWLLVYTSILGVAVIGRLSERRALVYLAAGMWLGLVVLPALIGNLCHRRLLQQRYAAARRLARITSWLHPADGWREQPRIIHAMERAQRGEQAAAIETLKSLGAVKSPAGLAAIANLYRVTNQWEALLAWEAEHAGKLEWQPRLLPVLLRARGETGDLRGLVELYERHQQQIGKLIPAFSRDMCRLTLFAFCGQTRAVESLLAGSLAIMPAPTRAFWLATAVSAAGDQEHAKHRLEGLLPLADPLLRQAVERRLARNLHPPEPRDAFIERVLREAELDHSHDERFCARPSLFSRRARGVQLLISLNLLMFAVEIACGGSESPRALYRLGALYPAAVRGGDWWRLVASLFLHFGAVHLAMNMLALWVLGPFVELALGSRRFIMVYLLAGIGSMVMVMAVGSGPRGEQMTVGASGCIMGLVGATGGLMLRGWLREKSRSARGRLVAMGMIVVTQTMFDSLVPQVSMTGHLSGAMLGLALVLLVRDRLQPAAPRLQGAEPRPAEPTTT